MAGTADGFLSYNDPSSIHFSSSAGGSRPVRDAADWASPDAVIQIPFDTLQRHHPDVRRLVEDNSSLIGTVNNLSNAIGQAQRSQSPPRNPTSQHAPLRQAQPSPTQGRHGSEEQQPPPRQLADFENPEFMLWTALDAQRFHSRYGRLACTRDVDGEIVSVAREKEIIAIVALIMEQADEFIHTLSQEEQKQIHNYNFFRTRYPWLLTKLATRIEHAVPELSYCEPTSQYKARRWMQSHFKARVETQRRRTQRTTQTGDESSSKADERMQLEAHARSQAQVKRASKVPATRRSEEISRRTTTKPSLPVGRQKGLAAPKRTSRSQHAISSNRIQPRASTSRVKLPSQSDDDSDLRDLPDYDFDKEEDEDDEEDEDHFSQNSNDPSHQASKRKAGTQNSGPKTKKKSRSNATQNMASPLRPTQGLSQRSLAPPITQQFVRQDVDDRTISAISALQALRQQDTSSYLVPPTTTAIREALRSRYASLDRWKIDSIENALEVLDEAVFNGFEGTEEADQQFSRWLIRLEQLQRNGDDEDTNFSSFGHDVIGTFAYRSQLKGINAFGGVQGACRLLAALLRIWSMSKEQLKERPDDRNVPIVEIHIPPAANVILKAFSPTDDDDEEEREIGRNTTAGTMPPAFQPQTSRPSLAADANEDRDGHHHNNAGTNRLPLAASQMASSSRGRGADERLS